MEQLAETPISPMMKGEQGNPDHRQVDKLDTLNLQVLGVQGVRPLDPLVTGMRAVVIEMSQHMEATMMKLALFIPAGRT